MPYIIEVISKKDNNKGFLVETAKGILISPKLTGDVKQFHEYFEADSFSKKFKLDRKGFIIKIRSLNETEILKQGTPIKSPMYCIGISRDNKIIGYVHFDTGTQSYMIANTKIGCCAWNDKITVDTFIAQCPPNSLGELIAIDLTAS